MEMLVTGLLYLRMRMVSMEIIMFIQLLLTFSLFNSTGVTETLTPMIGWSNNLEYAQWLAADYSPQLIDVEKP